MYAETEVNHVDILYHIIFFVVYTKVEGYLVVTDARDFVLSSISRGNVV